MKVGQIAAIILIVAAAYWLLATPQLPSHEEITLCKINEDCVVTQDKVAARCPVSINKKFLDAYNADQDRRALIDSLTPKSGMIIDYLCFRGYTPGEPICIENICDMKLSKLENAKALTTEYCNSLTDQKQKNSCFYSFVSTKVNTTDSVVLLDACKKITDSKEKDNCIMTLATNLEDAKLCNQMTTNQIGGCLANVVGDATLCTTDSCIIDASHKSTNSVICEKIKIESMKNSCIFNIAVNTNSTTLCEKLTYNSYGYLGKLSCYEDIAVRTSNSQLCDENQLRPTCNAKAEKNYNFCSRHKQQYEKDRCFRDMAGFLKAPEACESAGEEKDECNWDMGKLLNDATFCKKINISGRDTSLHDSCISDVARDIKNATLCAEIITNTQNYRYRDGCYGSLAESVDDCNKVEDSDEKEFCKAEVSKDILFCDKISNRELRRTCKISLS